MFSLTNDAADWAASGYRLPTDAEWEKAARGGVAGKLFPWGDEINHDYANYKANGSAFAYDTSPYTSDTYHPDYDDGGYPYTSPVGSFEAGTNVYGLYDMAGNVWEWCWDWYADDPPEASTDPRGPSIGSSRVSHGGSCFSDAGTCSIGIRRHDTPSSGNHNVGFRVVRRAGQ